MKLKLSLLVLSVSFIAIGNAAYAQAQSEKSLGLRKTDLYSEKGTTGDKTNYIKSVAGTSKRIERAFENAPPLIPHNIQDFPAINKSLNICLTCHLPEVAPAVKSVPIPPSHFISFRPVTTLGKNGELLKENKKINNTSDIKSALHKKKKLNNDRYVCVLCHVPQSTNAPLVKNSFEADFRAKDGSEKSNLLDVLNEGVK